MSCMSFHIDLCRFCRVTSDMCRAVGLVVGCKPVVHTISCVVFVVVGLLLLIMFLNPGSLTTVFMFFLGGSFPVEYM